MGTAGINWTDRITRKNAQKARNNAVGLNTSGSVMKTTHGSLLPEAVDKYRTESNTFPYEGIGKPSGKH